MRNGVKGLAAGALATAAVALGGGGVAQAQGGPVLEDGKTKAVYDYRAAIRERVFIPQPGIDQDRNGSDDWITIDILRPSEGSASNRMPAIIDPSPYYTTVCRGAEGQCMADWDKDGRNDRWPLFYDNYFVPRGYAYILAQMNGTGYTTNGCPHHGGPGDIAGEKSVIDWLNGRVAGYSAASTTSTPKVADWHNGSSAMIGKSYDGTLANGVAATGVEGLKTIVPVSAISAWYNYSRTGGIRHNTDYPAGLNNNVTTGGNEADRPPGTLELPERRTLCNPLWNPFSDDANVAAGDGDAHGDINQFWRDRDYVKDAGKVKASVFITHGFQDDNVRMDHVSMWWDALKANGVQLKLWLLRAGHEDPFESRRAEWADTLHRWFDHYLYGVQNSITSEPPVTIEDEKDVWRDYASWPIPGTQNVDLYLRSAGTANAGNVGGQPGVGATDTLPFTATATASNSESALIDDPTGSQATRRVFISNPLKSDIRLSGTATADLGAALGGTATSANLSVMIADLGAGTQVSRSSEGVTLADEASCWGVGTAGDPCEGKQLGAECTPSDDDDPVQIQIEDACYLNPEKPTQDVTSWRVTRGARDTQNRDSLWYADADALEPGEAFRLRFPAMPTEHTFKAGHQIAVIVGGQNRALANNITGQPNNVPVTLDARTSKVTLPIVGGHAALAAAGAFSDASGTVGGNVPATLSLTLGAPASFGAFTPGVARTYEASTTANVVSTAGDATLSVADPSSQHTGHLVNGSFFLPQPLQARARNAANTGTAYNNVGSSLNLLQYDAPVSNDAVSLQFSQRIDANDALRTGNYSKTLTFTLSTTNP
jgi:X-Pro dipeptidyl-peptidase